MNSTQHQSSENALRVLKKLYVRKICVDFRKPVVNMYPELKETYEAVIKDPMDLGTLIILVSKNIISDVYEIRRLLKLIFTNAITFNEGSYHMESVSNHINVFAKGLWEEVLNMPYNESGVVNSSTASFVMTRIQARGERFNFAMKEKLVKEELLELLSLFDKQNYNDVGMDILEKIKTGMKQSLATNTSIDLREVFKPLYDQIAEGRLDHMVPTVLTSSAFSAVLFGCHSTDANEHLSRLSQLEFIAQLDECIGEILVSVCERRLRGSQWSSVWSRGFVPIWSRPAKCPWWPASILAGSTVPDPIAVTNLSRIPEPVAKLLVRSKPKVASNSNFGVSQSVFCVKPVILKILNPPEGYVLVEFFGSHEFGWVKSESTAPIVGPGDDDLTPPSQVAGRSCSQESLDEMAEYIEWLRTLGTQSSEDVLPTDLESLERFVSEVVRAAGVSNAMQVDDDPMEEPKPRTKRKYGKSSSDEGKPPEYLNASLRLSNKVTIPSFSSLPTGASKKDSALYKTKLLVSWVNFSKPLGPRRGRSPFVQHMEFVPAPSLAPVTAVVAKVDVVVKPAKKHKETPPAASVSKPSPPVEWENIPRRDGNDDDNSTISMTDMSYQKESASSQPTAQFSGCVSCIAGEGVIHTKYIDMNAAVFFRENKDALSRKVILQEELQRVCSALSILQAEVAVRDKDKVRTHEQATAIGVTLPRRVIVNPNRSGGVAVGNAMIGLARRVLESQSRSGSPYTINDFQLEDIEVGVESAAAMAI